ncbi:hypothetical protein OKA05_12770 [Luteolibacter arcticus]|uniref:Uncharacterized protein n=1 Tax=Luteolibacter arcticus TaxID=1581411 RepID=A0ABT3GIT3_9BACT|nr:hypothetical protein [Luteolibacter arcticus]MCW1923430.1 hypothetical protein [Luteolibacter arcticus]
MATASSLFGILSLVLFLGLMSGFWAGIVGLHRAGRRGAAWWLMMIGIGLCTVGPILYAVGTWIFFDAMRTSMAGSGTLSGGGSAAPTVMVVGGAMIPCGLILLSVGFALHGFAAARMANRAGELEQLTAAMSEEIDRLRAGGPAS